MKTIFESILKKSDVGIESRIKEWYDGLNANEKKEVEVVEGSPFVNYVGDTLTIDKKFGEKWPACVNFNTAKKVVISFPSVDTCKQWPRKVLEILSITKWPNGMLTNIPQVTPEAEVYVEECALLTTLKGLDGIYGDVNLVGISSLAKLTNLSGLPSRVHNLVVRDCPKLTDLTDTSNLKLESLSIKACNALTSLKGLPETINGDLSITNNENLTSLEGLPRVVKGTLTIFGNGMPFTRSEVESRCKARRLRVL